MGKIVIYGKDGWPYTQEAREALGPDAEYHDVIKDGLRLTEMLTWSGGVRKVPVIIRDGEASIGWEGGT